MNARSLVLTIFMSLHTSAQKHLDNRSDLAFGRVDSVPLVSCNFLMHVWFCVEDTFCDCAGKVTIVVV